MPLDAWHTTFSTDVKERSWSGRCVSSRDLDSDKLLNEASALSLEVNVDGGNLTWFNRSSAWRELYLVTYLKCLIATFALVSLGILGILLPFTLVFSLWSFRILDLKLEVKEALVSDLESSSSDFTGHQGTEVDVLGWVD